MNKNLNSYQIPKKEGNGARFLHSNNRCSKKGLFRFFLKDETRLSYDTSISNTASSIVQFFHIIQSLQTSLECQSQNKNLNKILK